MRTFVHTINVVSDNEPDRTLFLNDTICRNEAHRNIYDFNKPNKIYCYSEFADRFTSEIGKMQNAYINRIDIAFDSDDAEYFESYRKYYRYLLTAFAIAYKSKNSFNVKDLLSDSDKSYWIKTTYFESTFYNKGLQIVGKSETENAMARFEIRLKRLACTDAEEIKTLIGEQVRRRFEKALEYLDEVQKAYNVYLKELYEAGFFGNVNDFVRFYQDRIFTREQLEDLLSSIDKPDMNMRKKVDNLIYRKGKDDKPYVTRISEQEMKAFTDGLLHDLDVFIQS